MLKESEKAVNTAFHAGFTKKICSYMHDCVREEVQSSTFRNLRQDKDNKWVVIDDGTKNRYNEKLFTNFDEPLYFDGTDSKVTELMIQSNKGQKDKYLIYGFLFLAGKNSKSRKYNEFLTPLLYMPCKLERAEDGRIECTLQDEVISLNTGALTTLMGKSEDEDDTEYMLEGILDALPDLPLTQEKLSVFLTTLKSLVPDVEIKLNAKLLTDNAEESEDGAGSNFSDEEKGGRSEKGETVAKAEDFYEESDDETVRPKTIKPQKVALTAQSALILTKRPVVTAGVLHELNKISEYPDGIIKETVLGVVNDEYARGITEKDFFKRELKDFYPITPLPLSDSQENVLKNIEKSSLVSVYGPPGTGKSQTIVNLVSHLIANGKTVLVASRMDKATDVIADRLNTLGAPYLALRAGRAGYQRKLAHDLDNLSKNLVELDEGFEDTIIIQNEDMEKLIAKIKVNMKKCDKIIKLESEWFEQMLKARENAAGTCSREFFATRPDYESLQKTKAVLAEIRDLFLKHDIFSKIKTFVKTGELKKLIGAKDLKITAQTAMKLAEEIKSFESETAAEKIENDIYSEGNLTELTDEIGALQKKQKGLAVGILRKKRREALKLLLRDERKIRRLRDHVRALTAKEKIRRQILEEQDFKPLLEAFPCQCVTTYAVSGSIPLKPGLFDVAIIDEASQCDIASCLPILFRAKKAVIVGDDKQLTHLSFLENAKEQSFAVQYDIPEKYRLVWSFRTNSMFDLANYYSVAPVLLDEHFRSLAPVIDFSNKEFYDGHLRIMTKSYTGERLMELCLVPGGKIEPPETKNYAEAEAVIDKVHDLIAADAENTDDDPVSIGIISPFRSQVELIKKAVLKSFPQAVIERHKIEVGTAHTFQGDERDVIIISWAIADNSFPQSLTFLQKPNLFNVAVTRARKKNISFLSKNPDELPQGLLRDYVEYIKEYELQFNADSNDEIPDVYNNSFEKDFAAILREKGLKVRPGATIAGFKADLLVSDDDGNSLVVECDGMPDKQRQPLSPIKKQLTMNRAGMKVVRISYRNAKKSLNACISTILNEFSKQKETLSLR